MEKITLFAFICILVSVTVAADICISPDTPHICEYPSDQDFMIQSNAEGCDNVNADSLLFPAFPGIIDASKNQACLEAVYQDGDSCVTMWNRWRCSRMCKECVDETAVDDVCSTVCSDLTIICSTADGQDCFPGLGSSCADTDQNCNAWQVHISNIEYSLPDSGPPDDNPGDSSGKGKVESVWYQYQWLFFTDNAAEDFDEDIFEIIVANMLLISTSDVYIVSVVDTSVPSKRSDESVDDRPSYVRTLASVFHFLSTPVRWWMFSKDNGDIAEIGIDEVDIETTSILEKRSDELVDARPFYVRGFVYVWDVIIPIKWLMSPKEDIGVVVVNDIVIGEIIVVDEIGIDEVDIETTAVLKKRLMFTKDIKYPKPSNQRMDVTTVLDESPQQVTISPPFIPWSTKPITLSKSVEQIDTQDNIIHQSRDDHSVLVTFDVYSESGDNQLGDLGDIPDIMFQAGIDATPGGLSLTGEVDDPSPASRITFSFYISTLFMVTFHIFKLLMGFY